MKKLLLFFVLCFTCTISEAQANLLDNGDFENEEDSWSMSGNWYVNIYPTCSGLVPNYAYVGFESFAVTNPSGTMSQEITLPEGVLNAVFSFDISINTDEVGPGENVTARLLDSDNNVLYWVAYNNQFGDTPSGGCMGWDHQSFFINDSDLLIGDWQNYSGEDITIQFQVYGNPNTQLNKFRIDDVSFEVEVEDCPTPDTPADFEIDEITSSSIGLNWDPVSNIDHYEVYECDGDFVNETNSSSWQVTNLEQGTFYSYYVIAVNDCGAESEETDCLGASTISCIPPSPPADLIATNSTSTSISIDWTNVSQATYYNVYYSNNGCSGSMNVSPNIFGTATTISGLACDTYYSFAVTAIDDICGESIQSYCLNFNTSPCDPLCDEVSIISNPSSLTATVGDDVILAFCFSGDPPFSYTWYGPVGQVSGTTTQNCVEVELNGVGEINEGSYYCVVTNCDGEGSVTSAQAELTIEEVSGQEFELNPTLSHLFWPFAVSNWSDEILSPERFGWRSGEEMDCIGQSTQASGICEDRHCSGEKFAQDWNKYIGEDCDQPIYSPLAGKVIYVNYNNDYSWCSNQMDLGGNNISANRVYIRSNIDTTFVFTAIHLKNTPFVSLNQEIEVGTQIGLVGITGMPYGFTNNVTSAHAHFCLYKGVTNDAQIYVANGSNQMVLMGVLDVLETGTHLNFDFDGCGSNSGCSTTCTSISPYAANFVFDAVTPGSGGGAAPNAVIQSSDDLVMCPGEEIELTAPQSSSYEWSTGATSSSIIVIDPGVYWVVVTDSDNNQITLQTSIEAGASNPVTIIASSAFLCPGDSVQLFSSVLTSTEWFEDLFGLYSWSNGDINYSTTVNLPGTYYLEYSSEYACSNSSDSIVIQAAPAPTQPTIIVGGNNQLATTSVGNHFQWYFSNIDNPILGAVLNSIDADTSGGDGFYWVEAFNEFGCGSLSDPVYVATDIEELQTQPQLISIYPNPNNGSFMIETKFGRPGLVCIEIFNLQGQLVYSHNQICSVHGISKEIRLVNEADGMYLVRAALENQSSKIRVLVNH